MKILVGISYYHPNISGLTIYAKRFAEEMVKRGHTVEVLTARYKKNLPIREKIRGVLVTRVWTPVSIGRGPVMPTFPVAVYKALRRSQIVNCHLPQFESVITVILAKLLKKNVILTYHCDLSGWPGFVNQVSEIATWIAQLIAGALADVIISYTEDYGRHSRFLSLFKKKVVYILPPVKLEPKAKVIPGNWQDAKIKIGFAGRISREKGLHHLFQTLPALRKSLGRNVQLIFAGPYQEVIGGNDKSMLEGLLEKWKQNLTFLGPLSQREMASFYKAIDVLVLPSTESLEAFGMVQVEAMMHGCPVVATDLPGVRVPIRLTGMGKLVPPKDGQSLAEAVVEVIRRREIFIKPKQSVKKIFNFNKTMDKLETQFAKFSSG